MKWAGATLALLAALPVSQAQEAPQLLPRPGRAIRDPDFRVETRQFGLDRQVEMLQWRPAGAGYEPVWNTAPIASAGFDEAHRNPAGLPIGGERWWATDATLNGRPLAPEVLRALGEWRDFRPSYNRLPVNLAATFQPDGDGLSSSENPLDPQIGDVRITWRELILPPLQGKVELRDASWHPLPAAIVPTSPAPAPEEVIEPEEQGEGSPWFWWLWGAGGVVGVALVTLVTLRRRRGTSSRPPR